jgi:lipoprotein-anchoring transpeptidase ErfK/SrfK
MAGIDRRKFLRLAGEAAFLAAGATFANPLRARADTPDPGAPPAPFGRVTLWGLPIRTSPRTTSGIARVLNKDDILPLYEQVEGEAYYSSNSIWYRTDGGYVYSSSVQPIDEVKNTPEPERAAGRFWSEVTVAYTDAREEPHPGAQIVKRLYYTGVFRVIEAVQDSDAAWWYRLQEGITYSPGPYVPAEDLRRIDPAELTPLSPDVADKRIAVDLTRQVLVAYENNEPVLTSRVSSGYGDFGTPTGEHTVLFKYPTARMIGGTGDDFYDLPGVAFPTFLTWSGVAIHAAYWHNDWGRRRSHGCLNVPAPVARWVWRWTSPPAPYEAATYMRPDGVAGTTVIVY